MNFKETRSHRAGPASLVLPFIGGAQAFHVLSSAATVENDHCISRSYSSGWNDRFPRFSGLTLRHLFLTYITSKHRSAQSQVLRVLGASPRWPESCSVFSSAEQEASEVRCLHAPLCTRAIQGYFLARSLACTLDQGSRLSPTPHPSPLSFPMSCVLRSRELRHSLTRQVTNKH